MIKTGIYGILRIVLLEGGSNPAWGYIILIAALVSGVYGVMNAIAQHDLKKLLAYHSIENIGIIGMGIGLGMIGLSRGRDAVALFGFLGALLHVFNHFTFKTLLFFGAGNIYTKIHTREIDRMGGLARIMPATSALFLVGSLAICGLPLFNGFISEFAVYLGLARGFSGSGAAARVALMSGLAGLAFIGVMAVLCFTKVFGIGFLGSPRRPYSGAPREVSAILLAPMGVLAGLIFMVGLLTPLVLPLLGPLARSFVPGGAAGEWAAMEALFGRISPVLAGLAGLILFFLVLRRLLLGRKPVRVFKTWDCGYQAQSPRFQYTASSFAAPFLKLIAPLVPSRQRLHPPEGLFPERASFESHGVDIIDERLVRPLVGGVRRFLGLFTWIQSGRLQNYMLYGIIFLIVLIIWILGIK
jgi:NADH:ubiquinone oxidoreductase subunit 5 (subunit L)/multisubunit Na+/H+ antiporter MnhA subunit